MMYQYYITYALVLAAAGITGYRIFRFFREPFRGCNGCGSDCSGCSLDLLKRAMREKDRQAVK